MYNTNLPIKTVQRKKNNVRILALVSILRVSCILILSVSTFASFGISVFENKEKTISFDQNQKIFTTIIIASVKALAPK